MFHQASSSQSSTALNGSGALSHVYVQYPPLRCSIPGARGLFYDDGNKLLISPTSHQVFSWKTSPYAPLSAPSIDPISEGPILSIRYSLDAKVLGIQRSNHEIQFWHRETGNTFSQRCKSDSGSILGFFWTDAPTCDVVFVKTSGLEMFSLGAELNSLHLVDTKRFSVSWYMYTHESRLVLFASGMQCKSFTGYQLSSVGIIRLPKFEMAIAKSEANSKPVLAAEDVHIVTVYGRIYCFQVDRVAMLLHSYRFYRDAVVQQGSLPIYSSRVALSVVDNVLLIHQVEAKVVILYDIFSDCRAPISAPLPLLLRGDPRSTASSSQSSSKDAGSSDGKELSDSEAALYRDSWTFLIPDMVCDAANGLLWKIHLDLEAISTSSSEVPSVLEFLQRRKLKAYKAKQLCLAMVRTIILERRPVAMVARAIDILVTSYSHSVKTGAYSRGIKADRTSSSAVPQAESPITADDSIHRVDANGKSVRQELANEVHGEPVKRSSTFSASDSEDDTAIEPQKNVAGGLSSSASTTENESSLQSEVCGPGYRPLNDTPPNHQEPQITSAAISPDEMYSSVFTVVEDEMGGDSSYLVSIIVEFLRSATSEKIKVHPSIYVLAVQLLARSERHAELGLFIINKILEPSKEVAMQLLDSGRQNIQIRKLGLDMLRQLSLHHDYVLLLVQDGYYLEALRYARKNKVSTVRPSLFLEAAYASNDSQHLAAVLRFFSDFIPGFKSTADYRSYCRIVAEVNSIVAA